MRPTVARLLPTLLLVIAAAGRASADEPAPAVAHEHPVPEPSGPAPRIVVEERVHDAGEVFQGARIVHAFVIRNEGQGVLRVVAHPDCGCTLVEAMPALAPGEEGKLVVALDTSELEGPVIKDVDLHVNDPANRDVVLSIRATVERALQLEPLQRAHLRGRSDGRVRAVRLFLFSVDGAPFDILEVKTQGGSPAVTVTPAVPVAEAATVATTATAEPPPEVGRQGGRKARKARKAPKAPPEEPAAVAAATASPPAAPPVASGASRYAVVIDRDPEWGPGEHSASVILRTSHAHGTRVKIPVTARIVGNIVVEPAEVLFGGISVTGTPAPAAGTRHVSVKQAGSAAFRILGARSTDPHFVVTVTPVTEGSLYDVAIRYVPGPAQEPIIKGEVILETSDAVQKLVSIPVHAIP